MEYDFSKLELLPEHIRLLKRLKRNGPIEPGDQDVTDLFDCELIRPTKRCRDDPNVREIEIEDKGKLYLQWRREDRFRHRWPVYLSVVSLIVSVIALITSFCVNDAHTTETTQPQSGQEQISSDIGWCSLTR